MQNESCIWVLGFPFMVSMRTRWLTQRGRMSLQTRRIFWCEELRRWTPGRTRYGNELDFGTDVGIFGMACRGLLVEIFLNVNHRGRLVARSGADKTH